MVGPGLHSGYGIIHHGGNSGYQAIGLAYMFGASKIILLGFDMQRTDNKSHWHGDHPKGYVSDLLLRNYAEKFPGLARDLKFAGVEVINCTEKTALTCFQQMPLKEAL